MPILTSEGVCFSPRQWSCTTSGSSMNELWRQVKDKGMDDTFKWSIIDRW